MRSRLEFRRFQMGKRLLLRIIEAKEAKIADFDKRKDLAQHVILSTTLTRVGVKIKGLRTAKEMWKEGQIE